MIAWHFPELGPKLPLCSSMFVHVRHISPTPSIIDEEIVFDNGHRALPGRGGHGGRGGRGGRGRRGRRGGGGGGGGGGDGGGGLEWWEILFMVIGPCGIIFSICYLCYGWCVDSDD